VGNLEREVMEVVDAEVEVWGAIPWFRMGRGGNKSSGNSTGKDFSPRNMSLKVKLAAD